MTTPGPAEPDPPAEEPAQPDPPAEAPVEALATAAGVPPVEPSAGERPRRRRSRRGLVAACLIGVLTLLLGFAIAVQVRSTDTGQQLAGAREEDLVRVLDDLTSREDRLRQQAAEQRAVLAQLGSSDTESAGALEEARQRERTLGLLDGTVAARGPGLELTVNDPEGLISAADLVNVVLELRGAGAETMQVDDVRVGVDTAVTGTPGDLAVDGQAVQAPYRVRVIGIPEDLAPALSIPGGVADRVASRRGTLDVVPSQDVVVDAVRPLTVLRHAEPADHD
ncbi:DUF881 domain-containing protein [Modestobacter sp. NPDC049651]|uniref:DUF881 domain-containing protein n=1 Tax=unclassified Modestobacter TaxID=2643866 RepID=UPI0033ED83A7